MEFKTKKSHWQNRGRIFCHVRPFYEWRVIDLNWSMHTSICFYITHSSFIEGSHITKNMAWTLYVVLNREHRVQLWNGEKNIYIYIYNIEGNSNSVIHLYIVLNFKNQLIIVKMTSYRSLSYLILWNRRKHFYTFTVAPPVANKNSKNVNFHKLSQETPMQENFIILNSGVICQQCVVQVQTFFTFILQKIWTILFLYYTYHII